jgi:4-phospho-D-threonate 3-dehydrogenase / 4-phospho-D-erythronate 3-dehydrogenase
MSSKPILGLTMGDPAGIGPEICLRALREQSVLAECVPVLFGDASILRRLARRRFPASLARVVSLAEFTSSSEVTGPAIVDFATPELDESEPSQVSATCGQAAYCYIEQAIRAALTNKIDGVVTAPIHKEALRLAGVEHPGHTEIFTALTGAKRSCMMLYSDQLTVSMVTTHIGYHQVPGQLSVERVLDVIELTAEALARVLHRPPRVGVCGLNPHAGEHGLFGQGEEETFVAPAVAQAKRRGIDADGPLVPDAAFTTGMRRQFDAFVCLYHDQGHIPFKMLAFDTGVNITLGLPIIRTSVDHGTAFDIAWQGKASPTSLYSAIHVAVQLAAGQQAP